MTITLRFINLAKDLLAKSPELLFAGRLVMRLAKETLVAGLHLMKIHWLIIRLQIIRELSSLAMKVCHSKSL